MLVCTILCTTQRNFFFLGNQFRSKRRRLPGQAGGDADPRAPLHGLRLLLLPPEGGEQLQAGVEAGERGFHQAEPVSGRRAELDNTPPPPEIVTLAAGKGSSAFQVCRFYGPKDIKKGTLKKCT